MAEQYNTLAQKLFSDDPSLIPDPLALFDDWLEEAKKTEENDPIAMSLATADSQGMPNCRMVLCNRYDERGYCFFTNGQSQKGEELAQNMKAALLFHWKSCRRQIRIRGLVELVSVEEADEYFATRPRRSQIGAHASDQSRPLNARAALKGRVDELEKAFEGQTVPRPAHWLGYRVIPSAMEFWQDGAFRLHDRVTFSRASANEDWQTQRLYP